MAGFEAGGGVGVEALGPLSSMWRGVYQKAAEAAEARLAALLGAHVLHLHQPVGLVWTMDGGGAPIVAPAEGLFGPPVQLPKAYEVLGWSIFADVAGSTVWDLRLSTPGAGPGDPGGYPPAPEQSIVGGAAGTPPTLSGMYTTASTTLAGWTTRLPGAGIVTPYLMLTSDVTLVTLNLRLRAL